MMLPLMHEPGCGGVAFWYEAERLRRGEPMRSEYARAADGSQIAPCTQIICTSCGKRMQSQPVVGA